MEIKNATSRGAKFILKHKNPLLFSISSSSNELEELYLITIDITNRIASVSAGDKNVYQINFDDIERKLVMYKHIDDDLVNIGIMSVRSETYDKRCFTFKIIEEKYGTKDLIIEFSTDGAEFAVFRGGIPVMEFISTRGPVGKAGGTFRVVSGERKNFVISLACLIYIAQVSLPKKDVFFRFYDTNQRPVFRTQSISTRPPRKAKKSASQKGTRERPQSESLSITYTPQPRKKREAVASYDITRTPSLGQGERDSRTLRTDRSRKKSTPHKRTTLSSPLSNSHSISNSTSRSISTSGTVSFRESTTVEALPEFRLMECWDRLEALASIEEN